LVPDTFFFQVLVSELAPPVTGPEPIHGLATWLSEHAPDRGLLLERTRSTLEAMDDAGVGISPQRYRDIARQLADLPTKVELPKLFQVDLAKPAVEATLGQAVVDEIRNGVQLIHRLAPRPTKNALDRLREAFQTRYEGREVPLVEALDDERGVGFDNPDGKGLAGPSVDEKPVRPLALAS
jgi:hypothetical protein